MLRKLKVNEAEMMDEMADRKSCLIVIAVYQISIVDHNKQKQ